MSVAPAAVEGLSLSLPLAAFLQMASPPAEEELESKGLSESKQELSPSCPGSPAEAWRAGDGAVEGASTAPPLLLLPGLASGSASTSDFLNA
ncbi:hypothetical protein EYF80_003664 [Liparis tanakae]|uniref:Uncharacterized protein n=1 Tax=Liparis tanakae TaxID=230148 RepID=A0A4Z2J8A1_9TELE|nr:hypothetical protein EYF80_003664 [Liparis tanakae]